MKIRSKYDVYVAFCYFALSLSMVAIYLLIRIMEVK